ncbi:hypothetical protein A3K64_01955 [Candidatus Micrarchaeota archaeon RBG_16_36_9]|nr:MAG: hypothetical protein A3K64_01955 [Candidatus Micrarchaeota archaeon RBG_16_36_9]
MVKILEQILQSIENKRKELTEEDKRYYGIRNLRDATPKGSYGGSPIRGFNAPFDQYELTGYLTDKEFEIWYKHKQRTTWDEVRQAGVAQLICPDCNLAVQKPEDMIRWAGIVRHGNCFIEGVESGRNGITKPSDEYYKRIKQVVFKK